MNDTALNIIIQHRSELEQYINELEEQTNRKKQPKCSIELYGQDGKQAFCTVDERGNIKSIFGFEFLKGLLEHNGIELEDFLKEKGWRLNELYSKD